MTELCHYLEWDSNFFQKRIARLNVNRLDEATAAAAYSWCAGQQIDCLYFLSDPHDPLTTQLAWQNDFRFVDIRLTVERPLTNLPPVAPPAGITIRPSQPADIPALQAIASVSHHDSRFYHDLNFPRAACDALYATWIEKSCQGYANHVLVAEQNNQAAGYVTCDLLDEATGQIGLIAVGQAARGQGVAPQLLTAGLHWLAQQGRQQMIVVTQARNLPAQRLYGRLGFLPRSIAFWYHRWF
jgi:dTDP-4-amino-4,6-dideoxy-D-galactose acyltransferase